MASLARSRQKKHYAPKKMLHADATRPTSSVLDYARSGSHRNMESGEETPAAGRRAAGRRGAAFSLATPYHLARRREYTRPPIYAKAARYKSARAPRAPSTITRRRSRCVVVEKASGRENPGIGGQSRSGERRRSRRSPDRQSRSQRSEGPTAWRASRMYVSSSRECTNFRSEARIDGAT